MKNDRNMNDKFYFQHDYNARNDQKLLELRAEYGAEGYGIWWMLCETLAEQDGIDGGAIGGLSLAFGVPKTTLEGVIEFCKQLGLLYEKNGVLRNQRMDEHKQFREKLSKAGKKGAQNRWSETPENSESYGPPNGPPNNTPNGTPNGDRMAKERKGKESKEKENVSLGGGKETLPIPEKKQKFWEKVEKVGAELGATADTLQAFFDYWAEHNEKGVKLKCEKQKTFNTKQRLQTWLKKEQSFKRSNPQVTLTEDQYMAMSPQKRAKYEHPLKMWGADRKLKIVERPGEAPKPYQADD